MQAACLRVLFHMLELGDMWLWLEIKQEGLRGLWSMFPLTRVAF